MQPVQRVTLVVVLMISALLGAYVWTGWVHAENGLVSFLATVLVVAAVGLLAGFQAARREDPEGGPVTGSAASDSQRGRDVPGG